MKLSERMREYGELFPHNTYTGWAAEVAQLEAAVEYARKQCYKHYDGDDACSCKIYNAALGGEE